MNLVFVMVWQWSGVVWQGQAMVWQLGARWELREEGLTGVLARLSTGTCLVITIACIDSFFSGLKRKDLVGGVFEIAKILFHKFDHRRRSARHQQNIAIAVGGRRQMIFSHLCGNESF